MARKTVELMNAEELKKLVLFLEARLKYVRYLFSELGGR